MPEIILNGTPQYIYIYSTDRKAGRARIFLGRYDRDFVIIKLVRRKDVVIREQTFVL
jgi:hypothetical protein